MHIGNEAEIAIGNVNNANVMNSALVFQVGLIMKIGDPLNSSL